MQAGEPGQNIRRLTLPVVRRLVRRNLAVKRCRARCTGAERLLAGSNRRTERPRGCGDVLIILRRARLGQDIGERVQDYMCDFQGTPETESAFRFLISLRKSSLPGIAPLSCIGDQPLTPAL
jgi:hypothetical protein